MADQISIQLAETMVAAGSAVSATVNFRTRSTAAASTPSSIRYRVDCLTNRREVIADTSVSAASSVTITVPGPNNGTIDPAQEFEVRQLTVTADYGLSTQCKAAVTWRVRNIRAFPFPHEFDNEEQVEPYYPINPAEETAGFEEADLGTTYYYGDPRRYGETADGVDATTAINNALSVDQDVVFYGGDYYANNLLQTHSFQRITARGEVRIIKNASGVLFTSSGDNVEVNGIAFRGDASSPTYTGDNINASGDNFRLINCGSRWAAGNAVLITGNHAQILGTCDIYQTTAAGAGDYDIVVGVSGTATLYHDIRGIYTSQASGGIRLIDTGSTKIVSSQFGKLFVDAGTSPAGVNGGIYVGNRILGAVNVEVSTAVFTGNQFGAVAITLAAATSGISIDLSNTFQSGSTVTNNGNANNLIVRQVSAGSTINLQFGDDSSAAIIEITPTASGAFEFNRDLSLKNTRGFILEGSSPGTDAVFSMSGSDNLGITNESSGDAIIFSQLGAGTINYDVNGARSCQFDSNNTAGNTRFLIYDVDNATLERVSVGIADSGGAGFKVLRIPN
jgi:hypothetical protein